MLYPILYHMVGNVFGLIQIPRPYEETKIICEELFFWSLQSPYPEALERRLLRDSSKYSSISSSESLLISMRKRSQVSAMDGLLGLPTKLSLSILQMLSPHSSFIFGLTPPRMTDFFNIGLVLMWSYGVSSARICQHKMLNE